MRDAGDGTSEATWAVEIEVAAKDRDDVAALIRTALSDGLTGLGEELQSARSAS